MGSYSSFYILKKLTSEVVEEIHNAYKEREDAFYQHNFLNFVGYKRSEKLGPLYFFEMNGDIYFKLIPNHPGLKVKFMREEKYNYKNEWLLPFTFEEMKIKDGRFFALSRVEEANRRLHQIPHETLIKNSTYWLARRDALRSFMLDYHVVDRTVDFIVFDTNDVFHEKNDEYVKSRINESVKELKEQLFLPHWTKK